MIELLLEAERALSFGMVDRAESLYRQVADADPHDSIAVVGLARVALERGDEPEAYRLARRALQIDPENEAARRLAVRLEEVLATRGQPVADPLSSTERAAPGPTAEPPRSGTTAGTPPRVAPTPPEPAAPAPTSTAPPRRQGRRSWLERIRRR